MSSDPASNATDTHARDRKRRRASGRGDEQKPPKKRTRRGDIALRNEALFGAYAVILQHKSAKRTGRRQKDTLRSLRLRGIGSRHLVYVNRAHLGMLRSVESWTYVYPTSLPLKAPSVTLELLKGKSAVSAETYKSSGGISEHRTYVAGEEAQIELHKLSFSVLWSAALPAKGFLYSVRALMSDGDGTARMSTVDNQPIECSFTELFETVEADPDRFTFIRVDLADRAVTWEAPDLSRSLGMHPYLPGQVGAICRQFEPDWLRQLLLETATPHVAADADGLLEATARLTKDFHASPETG